MTSPSEAQASKERVFRAKIICANCGQYASEHTGGGMDCPAVETSAPLVDLLRDLEIAARHCAVHGDGGANAALLDKARDAVLNYDWCIRAAICEHTVETRAESDEPLIAAVGATQKYADDYVEEYELAADEGEYTPSDHERMLIADAVNGLIADEDFLRLVRVEVNETEKRRKAVGECIECSRKLPEHWGGCSALKASADVCKCAKPEPALTEHGMNALCEKCYRPIHADLPHVMPTIDKQAQ